MARGADEGTVEGHLQEDVKGRARMAKRSMYRQGDLLIVPVKEIPAEAREMLGLTT